MAKPEVFTEAYAMPHLVSFVRRHRHEDNHYAKSIKPGYFRLWIGEGVPPIFLPLDELLACRTGEDFQALIEREYAIARCAGTC